MTPPRRGAKEPTATCDKEDLAQFCIQVISGLLTASGTPKARVSALLQQVSEELKDGPPQASPPAELIINVPHVASVWHNSPRYLHNGKPRSLALREPGPCLAEIIAVVYPDREAEEVLPVLLQAGAVRAHGRRYVSPARAVLFKDYPVGARIYALASLYGHAVAVHHNLRKPGATVQQAAMLTNFPQSEVIELLTRARAAADTTLHHIDDFMTRVGLHASSRSPLGTGGVGLYSFFVPAVRRFRRTRKA